MLALIVVQEELSLWRASASKTPIAVVVSAYWDPGGFGSLVIVFQTDCPPEKRSEEPKEETENGVMDLQLLSLWFQSIFPCQVDTSIPIIIFNHRRFFKLAFPFLNLFSVFSSWSLLASSR